MGGLLAVYQGHRSPQSPPWMEGGFTQRCVPALYKEEPELLRQAPSAAGEHTEEGCHLKMR